MKEFLERITNNIQWITTKLISWLMPQCAECPPVVLPKYYVITDAVLHNRPDYLSIYFRNNANPGKKGGVLLRFSIIYNRKDILGLVIQQYKKTGLNALYNTHVYSIISRWHTNIICEPHPSDISLEFLEILCDNLEPKFISYDEWKDWNLLYKCITYTNGTSDGNILIDNTLIDRTNNLLFQKKTLLLAQLARIVTLYKPNAISLIINHKNTNLLKKTILLHNKSIITNTFLYTLPLPRETLIEMYNLMATLHIRRDMISEFFNTVD